MLQSKAQLWKVPSWLTLNTDYSQRVYGLDLFRAVAIISVVLVHSAFIIRKALPGFPYCKLVDGVELFFVLSGFLIGIILIKIYEQQKSISGSQVLNFWKRRWFRTLPTYYLVLLLNILFVWLGITSGRFENFSWKFFLFLQNFNRGYTDFFWESWSLSIEEWFYIFTPLTILLLHFLLRRLLSGKYIFLIVILILIITPLLYRISISDEFVDKFWYDVHFRKVVITRLDAIMYGVLFAWFKYYYPVSWKQLAKPLFVIGLVGIYTLIYFHSIDTIGYYKKTFYFSGLGIAAAMLLPLADSLRTFRTRFGKIMTHISVVSYSMYLIHFSLVAEVIRLHVTIPHGIGAILAYFGYWVLVIVLSTLLYKYFEKPMMDLREKSTVKTKI